MVIAALLVVGSGARAAGDDDLLVPLVPPPDLARWRKVKAWEGTFQVTQQKMTKMTKFSSYSNQWTGSVVGTLVFDDEGVDHFETPEISRWRGMIKGTVQIDSLDIGWPKIPPSGIVDRSRQDYCNRQNGSGSAECLGILTIQVANGSYRIKGSLLAINAPWSKLKKGETSSGVSRTGVGDYSGDMMQGTLPTSGLVLSGSVNKEEASGDSGHIITTRTTSWELHPVGELPKVELVVDSLAYDAWRPEARSDEKTIGNEIKFEAKLQNPDGSVANVKAVKIIFELIDTSHEPGIAMNFPVTGAGKDCDLQFSPKSNPPGRYAITGTGNQRAETVPGEYTAAAATVSSFDWGGWSTLRVSAELTDGRHVPGHFRTKSGPTDILLPKRAARSNIAESWRHDVGVALSLPDNDDSDPGPAGNNNQGDGFTLYEEYRGFYVNGKHITGDPKKIDFFVRNYIRADAEAGIALFADLTGAEVHAPLLDTEFNRNKRVMNGNHSQGAHRVDQHGVFLQTQAGLDGGLTVLSKKGVRGRPVIVLGVNLQPHDSLTGMTTSENVPVSDLARAYDRAVAHELLHTVGAEHHGEGDGNAMFFFVFGDDPKNATEKAYFSFENRPGGRVVPITDETSRRDLAGQMEGDMMLFRESVRPVFYPDYLTAARKRIADYPTENQQWTAEQLADHDLDSLIASFGRWWFVGAEHGESSGNELCVMRYYFAKLYEKKGIANAFYYIRDRRSEHAGLGLCRSAEGTGINAKDHQPQPRYGDSAATRGACALSLIFNDAPPLKPDAIPPPPKPKP